MLLRKKRGCVFITLESINLWNSQEVGKAAGASILPSDCVRVSSYVTLLPLIEATLFFFFKICRQTFSIANGKGANAKCSCRHKSFETDEFL